MHLACICVRIHLHSAFMCARLPARVCVRARLWSKSSCPVIAVMTCHPRRRARNGWSGMRRTHTGAHTHTRSARKPCTNKLLSELLKLRPLEHLFFFFLNPQTDEIQHLKKPHLMVYKNLSRPAAACGLQFTLTGPFLGLIQV